ncbi:MULTISPECIES: hypothetical protein [unclassified Microcoleus]
MMNLEFIIGLDENISDLVCHVLVDLEPGDGVVLYTDGMGASQFCSQARNWSFEARGCGAGGPRLRGKRQKETGRRKEPKEVFLQI